MISQEKKTLRGFIQFLIEKLIYAPMSLYSINFSKIGKKAKIRTFMTIVKS